MTTLNKRYDAQVKALGDGGPGRFEAIVAVFDNVDLSGDRVLPGAFTKSLDRWRSAGDPIPVIWNHDWADPFSHIGEAAPADVIETSKGLHVVGTLDIANNPKAAQVYTLMKQRRVTEFSFSYAVDDESTARDGANNLKAVDLIEFGPTLKGMNPATELIAVKSEDDSLGHVYVDVEPRITGPLAAFMTRTTSTTNGDVTGLDVFTHQAGENSVTWWEGKAGRVISSKNEQKIRSAVTALGSASTVLEEVLASLGEVTPPDGGASSDQAKAEEPFGAKAEEPDEVAHADPVEAQWAELTKGLG